jgi:hypothetical protein
MNGGIINSITRLHLVGYFYRERNIHKYLVILGQEVLLPSLEKTWNVMVDTVYNDKTIYKILF